MKNYNRNSMLVLTRTGVCFLISLYFFSVFPVNGAVVSPSNSIKIVNKEDSDPQWKKLWDSARVSVQEEQYQLAVQQYKEILSSKPNIEEVKWELCKILILIEQLEEASLLLDSLLEIDPNRVEYLVYAGDVALKTGKITQATFFYGQALELDSTGTFSSKALKGFIQALIGQEKIEKALPLMEQLYVRGDISVDMLAEMAKHFRNSGRIIKAGYYYRELVEKYRVTGDVLRAAAEVLEQLGDHEKAVKLWEKYLEIVPEQLDIHEKVLTFYLAEKDYIQAIEHLNILLEHNINTEKYLLEAGKIQLYVFGRADKALGYYEKYQQAFPNGKDVSKDIANIQLILANDFLSIVENDGVWMLWRDLARVTPDRIGIYRAMADLLEELGKEKEFIEVLQIINVHDPGDLDVTKKLSRLYLTYGKYAECLSVLSPMEKVNKISPEYLLLKAECERGAKEDVRLLNTLQTYLTVVPQDTKKRLQAIILAGNIGNISVLQSLSKSTFALDVFGGSDVSIFLAYIDGLLKNHLLYRAEKHLDRFLETKRIDLQTRTMLLNRKAKIYEIRGDFYAAEQKYRENIAYNPKSINAVLDLAEFSMRKKDHISTSIWLILAEKKISYLKANNEKTELKSRLQYDTIKYIELTKGEKEAELKAQSYLDSKIKDDTFTKRDIDILLFLVDKHYRSGKYSQGKVLLEKYQRYFNGNTTYKLISIILNKHFQEKSASDYYETFSLSELFELYEITRIFGDNSEARTILSILEEKEHDFVRTQVLLADLQTSSLAYAQAKNRYEALYKIFSDENFFEEKIFELTYLSGDISNYIHIVESNNQEDMTPASVVDRAKAIASPISRRRLARALWTLGKWNEALQIYDDLELILEKQVSDAVDKIKKQDGSYREFYKEKDSRWNVFSSPPDDTEIIAHVMSLEYFSDNITEDTALISASSYASYKWLTVIKKEYEAKKSLSQKEFYQAEKDYQKLIEDDDFGDDIYPDLATIYSRLGRSAKEAEMIERIKERQIAYPGMKTAIDQNARQRKPQVYIDTKYIDEEGRDGYKNITQIKTASGVRFQPTIFQEIGFGAGWTEYGNSDEDGLINSTTVAGEYTVFFKDLLESKIEISAENLDNQSKPHFIYDFTIKSRLEDSVTVHAGLSQERVSDTIDSVEDGIYRRAYGAGLIIDYLPSVFMGFDFDIIRYNDGNDGKRFKLWSSYRIFSDTSMFDFSYNYEKLENDILNDNEVMPGSTIDEGVTSYWSPANYWRHSAAIEYRRELWPTGRLYSGTSYVSAKYGIGYESYGNLFQRFELNIFLEIHPSILLKGTFLSDWTEGYDRNEGYGSFVYRW